MILPDEHKDYITVPYLGPLFGMTLTARSYIYPLDDGKRLLFSLILFLALLGLMLAVTYTGKGWVELSLPIFCFAIYCLFNAAAWPVVLRTGEPQHDWAWVLEKEVEEHSGRSGGDEYYLTLMLPDGEEYRQEVMPRVYRAVNEQELVSICWNTGLLGDYYYIHESDGQCP